MTELSATIGTLIVKILGDSSDLQKEVKNAEKSLQDVSSESQKASKSMDGLDKSASKSGKSLRDVGSESQKTSKSVDGLDKSVSESGKSLSNSADDADEFSDSLKKSASSADKTSGDVDELTSALKKEGDAADKAGDKTEAAGDKTEAAGDQAEGAAGKNRNLKTELNNLNIMGFGVVAGLMAAAGAMIAVANAAQEAEKKVEAAYKVIRVGTGATGEELEGHMEVFERLNSRVSNTEEQVAAAVAKLSRYYGVEGDELERLAKQYLDLSKLTDTDVTTVITEAHDAFNKWGVSIDEQADKLDLLFNIGRDSTPELLTILSDADKDLQLLGLSIDDAAALISNAELTNGIEEISDLTGVMERSLSQILSKQNTAVAQAQAAYDEALAEYTNLTEEYSELVNSDDASEAAVEAASAKLTAVQKTLNDAHANLQKTLNSTTTDAAEEELRRIIDAMREAASEEDAVRIGSETFGRNTMTIAKVLHSGALGFEELKRTAEESSDTLSGLVEETQTTDEKLTVLGKHINDRLEPAGAKFVEMLLELEPAALAVADAIAWVSQTCGIVTEKIGIVIEKLGLFSAGEGVGAKALQFLGMFADVILNVVSMALDGLIILLDLLAGDTESAMERFKDSFLDAFMVVYTYAFDFMKGLASIIESGINMIMQFVEDALNAVLKFVENIANSIIDVFTNAVNLAVAAVNTLIDGWNAAAAIFGGPQISHLAEVSIAHVSAPKVEMGEVSALTDALNQQYEALAKAAADRKGETTNNYNITINAKDKESGTSIANKTSKAMNRNHAGGVGI